MTPPDPITAAISAYVEAGELAGANTLVWRGGEITHVAATGWRDLDARAPLQRDTIFRIASMTKPVTCMAALTLLDEGRFALDDPITRWAPEFAHMRVLKTPDGALDDTVPAQRDITFEDLLTHRAGLTYGDFHAGPIAAAYAQALGADIDSSRTPDAWIAGLGALPLIDQPGAGFHYGQSIDLLGLLIARIDGAPLGEVLRRRVFAPLGMADTGFIVPPASHGRRSRPYGFDAAGRLTTLAVTPGGATVVERPADMTFCSGGAGLWSTLDDYLAFARQFLGEGPPLLRPQTLALMTANRLTPDQRATSAMFGMPLFNEGHGFGLGVAVVTDPQTATVMRGRGGVGTVSWPGAFGGWWQADPTDGSVMILLAHNMMELDQMAQGIGLGVYAAITDFHALASAG